MRGEKPENNEILTLEAVSRRFGGIKALTEVSFSVEPGVVLGLIGPNGAGKTTLFNAVTGAFSPNGGRIVFQGREIQGFPLHKVVGLGIARTFQNVEMFQSLNALENVMVGCHARSSAGFWGAALRLPFARHEERRIRERSMELLDFVGMAHAAETPSGELPFGWQRLVEIARALAAEPKLLLMDEPAAGLNASETNRLAALIDKIRDRGVTIILVEHDMSLTMTISDRIVVLDQGRVLAEGTPREIQANPAVMAAYLGTEAEEGAED